MKKLILILLMLPCAAYAAKWTKVGSTATSEVYIDKSAVVDSGGGKKLWTLTSYASAQTTPDGQPYLSVKALHLYSCEERTTTLLSQVYYADKMGKGEPLQTYKYAKFEPEDIIPDSPSDAAAHAICPAKM